jgi:hypothetical protein
MSGATAASYRYQAFGTPLQIGNLENPFQYLCIYVYGVAGLGFPSSGPYDPGTGQSLNDNPISFPSPNPFQGSNPMAPSGDDGSGGRSGGELGGGSSPARASGCVPTNAPQIYPKGWKGFAKSAKKYCGKPKRSGPKKGAGTEYIGVLPAQETVQAVADFGYVIRCQFAAAANTLGP